MAKKKNAKSSERTASSLKEALGLDKILFNERVNFVIGICLLLIAIYMVWAFVSYLFTGAADQSLIEFPQDGEIMNEKREFQNACGSLGAYISWFFIKRCFGLAAFLIPIFVVLLSVSMMRVYKVKLLKWFMCLGIILVWASITMAKFLEPLFEDACYNPGGDHGLAICQQIEGLIGMPGLTALLGLIAIAFLCYLSMETVIIIRKIFNPLHYLKKIPMTINAGGGDDEHAEESTDESRVFDNPETEEVIFDLDTPQQEEEPQQDVPTFTTEETVDDTDTPQEADDTEFVIEEVEEEEAAHGKSVAGNYGDISTPYDPKRDLENYRYPTLDLLQQYESDGKPFIDMIEQNTNKNRIVDVLRNFGVEISSIKATVGPTITLYEITPAPGVRISRIRNLEDDIALSLSALGIRIIAPIPGKGTIGIEVPNAKPQIVSMESILNSKKFQETTMELPMALGKTITNEVFIADLVKMPHLLVAGATGQGKSVGLNAIITSLLYKKHPAELKFVMVDPKKVEFPIYSPIVNHFLAQIEDDEEDEPIITDVQKVVNTLKSLCVEMDTRYDLLKKARARNIKEYNEKFKNRQLNPQNGHKFMPYIVVIIDEFGDLIMTAGKEIELPIARIAQLARAVGIHMIIATQRPTTNIITGTIKANFPARMAFKVSAMVDSRTILDRPGANQLVGKGDMLFLAGSEPVRLQCAFVDTPEVEAIANYIACQQSYTGPFALPRPPMEDTGGGVNDADLQHLDPMFAEAAQLIVSSQQGSTSMIQRKFAIGYNRAGRLMDQLEKAGVVGPAQGAKPRDVLIQDAAALEMLLNNLG